MEKLFKHKRDDIEEATKFKISIIGDMGTGKTCLSLRFVKDLFTDAHKATISG
jgi:GTPase SAR1 family protein